MTASEQTIERARGIGRAITEALSGLGFRANSSVRTWSSSNIEELRRLPKNSAILGIVVHEGGRAFDAAPHVADFGAEIAHVGDNVIVLEVAEQPK
jgi:uroporphyrinogen-III synthase